MASQHPGFFDDVGLTALERAMQDILATLKMHYPHHDWERDKAAKGLVARRILNLSELGITDPDDLTARAIDALPFQLNG